MGQVSLLNLSVLVDTHCHFEMTCKILHEQQTQGIFMILDVIHTQGRQGHMDQDECTENTRLSNYST